MCLHPLKSDIAHASRPRRILKMDPHFHNKRAKWKFWYLTTFLPISNKTNDLILNLTPETMTQHSRIELQFLYYLFLAAVIISSRASISCDDRLVLILLANFSGSHKTTCYKRHLIHPSYLHRSTSSEFALELIFSLLNWWKHSWKHSKSTSLHVDRIERTVLFTARLSFS